MLNLPTSWRTPVNAMWTPGHQELKTSSDTAQTGQVSCIGALISCREAPIRCNLPIKSKGNQKTPGKTVIKPGRTDAGQREGHIAPSTIRGLPALHADKDTRETGSFCTRHRLAPACTVCASARILPRSLIPRAQRIEQALPLSRARERLRCCRSP